MVNKHRNNLKSTAIKRKIGNMTWHGDTGCDPQPHAVLSSQLLCRKIPQCISMTDDTVFLKLNWFKSFKAQSKPSWLSSWALLCKSNSCFPSWDVTNCRCKNEIVVNSELQIKSMTQNPCKKYSTWLRAWVRQLCKTKNVVSIWWKMFTSFCKTCTMLHISNHLSNFMTCASCERIQP